jgi:hypothetical protein
VGLGAGLVQGATPPRTSEPVCLGLILWPVTPPPILCTLHLFILGEVAVDHSHRHVWLVAQDVLGPLHGLFCYSRHFCHVLELASLCMSMPVCFLSFPCGGGVMV